MTWIAAGVAIGSILFGAQSESEKQTPIQQGKIAQPSNYQYQPTVTQQGQTAPRFQDVLASSQSSNSSMIDAGGAILPAAPKYEDLLSDGKTAGKGTKKPATGEKPDVEGQSLALGDIAAAAQIGGQIGGMLFQQPNLSLQGQLAQPSNYQYQPTVDPNRRIRSFY